MNPRVICSEVSHLSSDGGPNTGNFGHGIPRTWRSARRRHLIVRLCIVSPFCTVIGIFTQERTAPKCRPGRKTRNFGKCRPLHGFRDRKCRPSRLLKTSFSVPPGANREKLCSGKHWKITEKHHLYIGCFPVIWERFSHHGMSSEIVT